MLGFGGISFGMGWWWIIGIIIVAAIVWGIVRKPGQNKKLNIEANKMTVLDIMSERYALCEIVKNEFELKNGHENKNMPTIYRNFYNRG